MYNLKSRFMILAVFAIFSIATGCDEAGWDESSTASTPDEQIQSAQGEVASPCACGEGCDCGCADGEACDCSQKAACGCDKGCDCGCADGEPCDCAQKGACGCAGHGGGTGSGACGCGGHGGDGAGPGACGCGGHAAP
jgi:hypothetical protein